MLLETCATGETATWCFEDLCLYIYCIVDDALNELKQWRTDLKRPGPTPLYSDSELIALTLIGECKGWHCESQLLREMAIHKDLFPHLPGQSRFNRRRRQLGDLTALVRRTFLKQLDVAQDKQCLIDSMPIPVVHFHLVPAMRETAAWVEWTEHEAAYGYCASRKQHFYGYKLQLLTTGSGLILDFSLTPGNVTDLKGGEELLRMHQHLDVVGDKGYISAPVAAELWNDCGIRLLTRPRSNQKGQLPAGVARLLSSFRQLIETVNAQLNSQFNIETNYAHTFAGLKARLYTKLTAHTLCIYINRLLGNPDWLQIKHLAMP